MFLDSFSFVSWYTHQTSIMCRTMGAVAFLSQEVTHRHFLAMSTCGAIDLLQLPPNPNGGFGLRGHVYYINTYRYRYPYCSAYVSPSTCMQDQTMTIPKCTTWYDLSGTWQPCKASENCAPFWYCHVTVKSRLPLSATLPGPKESLDKWSQPKKSRWTQSMPIIQLFMHHHRFQQPHSQKSINMSCWRRLICCEDSVLFQGTHGGLKDPGTNGYKCWT